MYEEHVVFLRDDVQLADLKQDEQSVQTSIIPAGIRPSIVNLAVISADEIKRDLNANCAMKIVHDQSGDVVARTLCIQVPIELGEDETIRKTIKNWLVGTVAVYNERQVLKMLLRTVNALQTNQIVSDLFCDGAARANMIYVATYSCTQITCQHKHTV